ncbi:MAG TPA: SDR family NAD(P)-dependent oxidoreductase [Roseiarcus sp.]|nr:SDR family NAD(P)-dependent oxidoreductase [Roseiarcus sp.]
MKGKTVVVTGGFGALGRAVAEAAAQRGASVAALDVAPQAPAGLAERLGPGALLTGGVDLSTAEGAAKAMAAVKAKYGRLDALINIAGGFRWEKVESGDAATWDFLFALNLKTALNASKAAIPSLLESGAGRIVNVGAGSALKAAAGIGPYAASKAAVHKLTESLAEEFKNRGVTVNAVLPSIIDTPANRADMPKANFDHWVRPIDLAAVILFLASDEAKAVTGALIPVTGGV